MVTRIPVLMRMLMNTKEAMLRRMCAMEDWWFDMRHGIDTTGVVTWEFLKTDSAYRKDATAYHAAWCRSIRILIRKCAALGIRPEVFIDIGSGKGKPCFYAATIKRFKRIIGLEFDTSLVDQANVFRKKGFTQYPIEFLHADAASYQLGEMPQSLLFMFNPFGAEVMRLFLKNNSDAMRKYRHVIAYSNDMQREVLEEFGMEQLFRDSVRKMSLWQYK